MKSLFDDFTGEPAHQTVVFGFDGSWFELDLADANTQAITETLTRWRTAGRRRPEDDSTATETRAGAAKRTQAERDRAALIRAWAQNEGMDVPMRGRIAKNVIRTYAHAPPAPGEAPDLHSDPTKNSGTNGRGMGRPGSASRLMADASAAEGPSFLASWAESSARRIDARFYVPPTYRKQSM